MWGRSGWHRSAVIQPGWDEGVEYLCFCARKILTFTSCLRWKKHQYSFNLKSLSIWKPKLEPIDLKCCAKRAQQGGRATGRKLISFNMPFFTQSKSSDIFSKCNSSFSNVWSISGTSGFSIVLDSFYFILHRTTLSVSAQHFVSVFTLSTKSFMECWNEGCAFQGAFFLIGLENDMQHSFSCHLLQTNLGYWLLRFDGLASLTWLKNKVRVATFFPP